MCAQFAPIIEEVQRQLARDRAARLGQVTPAAGELDAAPFRIVFKHFPLNKACNKHWHPIIPMPDHEYSCEAAAAAEAARLLGGSQAFWKMHNEIYRHREVLKTRDYRALARDIGLDVERFEELRSDPKTMDRVVRNTEQAAKAGVGSTPSVFLDGRRVEHPIKRDLMPPLEKTVQMWSRLLMLSNNLKFRATDTRPRSAAGTQPRSAGTQGQGIGRLRRIGTAQTRPYSAATAPAPRPAD